uniref:Uncharacterized protein n=1 Tax=Cacopsylla melanoneura TaxID=428564 RepID=A0A8D9E943_9HEMI
MSDEPEYLEPETVLAEDGDPEIEEAEDPRIVEDEMMSTSVQDESRIIEDEVKVEEEVKDENDDILGDLSAMTMEQLDDFLEENEEQDEDQPEEDEFEGNKG